jgi:hypothetical protein
MIITYTYFCFLIIYILLFVDLILKEFDFYKKIFKKENEIIYNGNWVDPLGDYLTDEEYKTLYNRYYENENPIKRNKIIKFPLLKNK